MSLLSGSGASVSQNTGYTIDMNPTATTYSRAVDFGGAATLISATSKPGSPQITITLTRADHFPTDPNGVMDYTVEWAGSIAIAGQNTDAGNSRVIHAEIDLNGSAIGVDPNATILASNYYYVMLMCAGVNNIFKPGDVITIFLWGSVTNTLNYEKGVIYTFPRLARGIFQHTALGIECTVDLVGASAGYSYATSTIPMGVWTYKHIASGYTTSAEAFLNLWGGPNILYLAYGADDVTVDSNAAKILPGLLFSDMDRYHTKWKLTS